MEQLHKLKLKNWHVAKFHSESIEIKISLFLDITQHGPALSRYIM